MNRSVLLRVLSAAGVMLACSTFSYAQGGSCKDPWINQAYNELYHRAPAGSGATGECNISLYGGGHWTTYADLESKIIAVRGRATAVQAAPVAASSALHLDRSLNIVNSTGGIVARAGTFSLVGGNGLAVSPSAIVAQGGGNIVAQGGGNIVAQGGGNIVAQGGGNMRSLQSVDSKPTFVVK
jgi:hypothetical protein